MREFRLILDGPLPGAENMAVDEALLRAFEAGISATPTLRLYGWSEPTISAGYLQNVAPFLGLGLPVVRRATGGRAVLHQFEATYSVVAPSGEPPFEGGILEAYSVISRCIVAALRHFGIEAEFSKGSGAAGRHAEACFFSPSRFEVLVGGRKLVGSSQRRYKKAFLQHGSIIFSLDTELNKKVFGEEVLSRMCSVGEFKDISPEEFRPALINGFEKGLGAALVPGALGQRENYLKASLLSAKYSKGEWNRSCARRYEDPEITE